jgi:hypothetical protein
MHKKDCICKKPARVFFTHLSPLCRECFALLLRRRARKAIRDHGELKPNQKVFIDGEKVVSILFKSAVTGLPLKYVPKSRADSGRLRSSSLRVGSADATPTADVIITGKTADDEAVEFLENLFAGKKQKKSKSLNIFENITSAELEKYCELKKIIRKNRKKSELRQKLEELEQRYPGIMFALQKSSKSF